MSGGGSDRSAPAGTLTASEMPEKVHDPDQPIADDSCRRAVRRGAEKSVHTCIGGETLIVSKSCGNSLLFRDHARTNGCCDCNNPLRSIEGRLGISLLARRLGTRLRRSSCRQGRHMDCNEYNNNRERRDQAEARQ